MGVCGTLRNRTRRRRSQISAVGMIVFEDAPADEAITAAIQCARCYEHITTLGNAGLTQNYAVESITGLCHVIGSDGSDGSSTDPSA